MAAATAYSGTPLAKKLGMKAHSRMFLIAAPQDYAQLLTPLPAGVQFLSKPGRNIDIAHLFVVRRRVMSQHLSRLREALDVQASIWVSWPKKAAKVPTDITEDTIREVALPLGLVDIKVCAVTDVWSGLKLVLRKQLR
jgi:hypothetical protein